MIMNRTSKSILRLLSFHKRIGTRMAPSMRMARFALLLAVGGMLSAFAPFSSAVSLSERAALLNLYNATNGSNWTNHTGWGGAQGSECTWFGVACAAGAVGSLSLPNNNLSGSIPDLGGLSFLQGLDFTDNSLSGHIPYLSNPSLRVVLLHNNHLSGPFPTWNASAPLHSIDVSSNALTGPIPSLSASTTLQSVDVSSNLFSGSIPDLSGLSSLVSFIADWNQFTGPIPPLPSGGVFQVFTVSSNNLSGTVPSIVGMTALQIFDVSNNQLTGSLPASYPNSLQKFYASNNSLSGSMPSLAATQLLSYRVNGNAQLTGQVGAGPNPDTLVASDSKLCPTSLAASGNMQVNAQWDAATGHTPWHYNNTCAQQPVNMVPPLVTMTFNRPNIVLGAGSQMTITMSNPNAQQITNISFADSYPMGIQNAANNPVAQNNCGTLSTMPNGTSLSMSSSGIIAAHSSCTIAINVVGTAAGTWSNSTGLVTSSAPTSYPAVATLTVLAMNHPPAPQDDQVSVAAFQSTTVIVGDARIPSSVLDNDTDPDPGDYVVLATVAASPVCGNLTLNPDGTFTYQSTTDQCLTDSFKYNACDTYTSCVQATVHINITGANPNYSPVAIDDAIQVTPGGTSTVLVGGATSLLANDFDPNVGQTLSIGIPGTGFSNAGTYTLNADGTFSYQNTNSNATTDEFQYSVCDNALPLPACAYGTVHITISDVPNHLPVAVDDATHVTPGFATSVLDGGANSVLANDSDPDPGQTATLIALPVPNGGPSHGTLTLNNNGTFTYQNTDANASTDSFMYQARDVFGATSVATVTIEITDVINQPPIANGDALQVPVGGTATTLTGGASSVLANDTDPDPGETATLTAHLVGGQPGHGQLALNTDGTFSYHHNGDAATTDSFTYEARDIHGAASAATVTITIGNGPVNLPPFAVDDAMQVAPGGTATVLVDGSSSVLANDFDPNPGDTATMTAQQVGSAPAHGTLTFHADGSFSYHAFNGQPTTDSFQYQACDIHGACTATPATVSITIGNGALDNLPIAIDDAIQVAAGGTSTTLVGGANSVLANDSDPDPGETATLTATLIGGGPAHGSLTLNSDGTFNYHHNGDAATTDSFVYEAKDVHGGSSSATVTITIGSGPVNHLPFAVDDAIDVALAGTSTKLVGGAASVLANDVDPDPGETAALTAKLVGTGPSHGTLTFNADGTFNYQNFMGDPATTDVFQYQACDIHGACAEGVVTISIGNGLTNHLPIAVDDEIQVVPSGTATVLVGGATSVLANDFDPDQGETATLSAVKMSGLIKGSGTITLNADGSFSYHNHNPAIFADTMLYEACDIHGACAAGTITVTVTNAPMNHLPTAAADAIQVAAGGTATTLIGGSSSVLGNDSDPDPGEGLTLTAKLIGAPAHGTVTLTLDGAFSYHNDVNDPATSDNFVYEACDIHGGCSAATVSITIGNGPVNSPPIAVNDLINVASNGTATALVGGANSVLANDSDPDPGETATLVAELVSGPAHGTLTFNTDGTFSYHNNGDASVNDAFSYRAQDVHSAYSNVATVQIVISGAPTDNPPVAADDAIQVAPNGIATTLVSGAASVLANDTDPDGDPLSATLMGVGPTQGTLTLNIDGTFSYRNTNSNATSDSFSYLACDNAAPPLCDPATVSITIGAVGSNQAPIAVGDAIEVTPNGTATMLVGGASSVLANDIDPDGDPLTAAVVSAPSNGTLGLNPDGTFNYQNTNANASSDSFQYKACDNRNPPLCATATVTITIGNGVPVNHVPFATGDAIQLVPNGIATALVGGATSVLANDVDPDPSDTLTAVKLTDPSEGTVALNTNGTFSYHNTNANAVSDSFEYQACDNHGACDMGVVTITIGNGPSNHLPIVVDDAIQVAPNGTATTLIGGASSVLDNDSDPDGGDTLSAVKMSGLFSASGTLMFSPDGTFSYQNTDPNATSDTFLYEACDQHGACTSGVVSISIKNGPLDQAPIPMDDAIVVAPNGTANTLVGDLNVPASVLDNDTDPDAGDALKAHLIDAPSNGHVTLNTDGTFVYVNMNPVADSWQYEACDASGACVAATVSVTINQQAPTVSCVLPKQVDVVGDAVSLDLSLLFTPPAGQTLSYSATNPPPTLSIMGSLLSGTLTASGTYTSALNATTTVPGGASASENVIFEVLPAGEILLRDGFDTGTASQPCQ